LEIQKKNRNEKKRRKKFVLKVVLWANSDVKACEKVIIGYEEIMVLSSIMLLYFVTFKHHSYLLLNEFMLLYPLQFMP
jgi:positive regulator of sigma E activity